MDINVEDSLK